MTAIYDQFDKATAAFTASALILDGKPAGRIVIKHGAAATAFVQVWGVEMVKGRATGGGYDKASAAVFEAISRLPGADDVKLPDDVRHALALLRSAGAVWNGGTRYTMQLEAAGFTLALVI